MLHEGCDKRMFGAVKLKLYLFNLYEGWGGGIFIITEA
jgi:hypothetical protein